MPEVSGPGLGSTAEEAATGDGLDGHPGGTSARLLPSESAQPVVGALRHTGGRMQVVSLLAMEPPAGADSGFLQDEKAKVIAAMRPIAPDAVGSWPVRRLPRRAGRRSELQCRNVRGGATRDRLVAVGRSPLVHPCRQGAARRAPPRPCSSCASRRGCCSTSRVVHRRDGT